ncbi:LysR family transcriptional regulator [Clostridium thailandense]|uniref:LysR family transcriptional regulator n=1 Tax=Clostridium thailandense TaxID=2794346 RepID=A0A949TXX7_9CLOT|nr:LysR family transcriptional regulator [Clostridium thailandense]MBV7272923.1 LysR family transcriptional regulator [Clostridium thailandense]MCH5136266.1 LysR family transcriptional regulator [Clostridiaceae bacterium UIB06]
MNLYHLRYFVTLARLEHYTKAAEELLITQPSLSHAISLLEKELGVSLFEKEGRNVVLTKCGKIFLDDIVKSLEILDSSTKTLKMISSGEGRIDLAFLRTLGTDFVPEITRSFLQANQEKSIEFHFHTRATSADIIQGLKERKYDIAFCSKLDKEQHVEFIPILKQELVLIVPPDHPLANKDTVDLVDTIPYPQIFFTHTSGLRPIIDNLFEQIGEQPKIIYEIEEDQVIAGLVSKSFGIAVCPNMPILNFMNLKVLQITSPSFERIFYLAVMKDKFLAPVVYQFKNFAIEHANRNYLF